METNTTTFGDALGWLALLNGQTVEALVNGDGDTQVVLTGTLTVEPEADGRVVVRVGPKNHVTLYAEEFDEATQDTDGVRLLLRGVSVGVHIAVSLRPQT